jgi:hypothetical protein
MKRQKLNSMLFVCIIKYGEKNILLVMSRLSLDFYYSYSLCILENFIDSIMEHIKDFFCLFCLLCACI